MTENEHTNQERSKEDLAQSYYLALPLRIRDYLNRRGILDRQIEEKLLGWNGSRITIPVRDRERKVAFFRLARDPESDRGPKMLSEPGSSVELYGWEWLKKKPPRLMICEGEFDRLVFERHDIPAVTSTGGAGIFRKDWAEAFESIPEVYVCFDRDEAGRNGALRVARMISGAKVVTLPDEVGDGGDVTDFFVRLGKSRKEFLSLLRNAQTPSPLKKKKRSHRAHGNGRRNRKEVEDLKSRVELADVVGGYVRLREVGGRLAGRCPFHDDQNPSFSVYPGSESYYCFGCHEHGDLLDFLMKMEDLTFPEALKELRRLAT